MSLKQQISLSNFSLQKKTLLFFFLLALESLFLLLLHSYFPGAGKLFLPVYFFTLAGLLVFGIEIGAASSLFLPLFSFLVTGMPSGLMLFMVIAKSLFFVSAYFLLIAKLYLKLKWAFLLSFLFYQSAGLGLGVFLGLSSPLLWNDFQKGFIGLFIQLVLGGGIALYLDKKNENA